MTAAEQRVVLKATRTPQKVRMAAMVERISLKALWLGWLPQRATILLQKGLAFSKVWSVTE
jgi:hypothetical protein